MRFSLLIALLIAVAAAGAMQAAVPPLVEQGVERALVRSADRVNYIDVDAEVLPAAKVLTGRIDRLTINSKELVVGGLPIAAFVASAQGLQVDLVQMVRHRELEVESVRRLRVTVIFSEAGLNRYLWENVDPSRLFSIRLVGGFARLVGQITILGRPIELTLDGRFQLAGDTAIEYIPTDLAVAQTRIPKFLLDTLLQDRRFIVDLAGLPLPVELESIEVEDGQVYVFGKERDEGAA